MKGVVVNGGVGALGVHDLGGLEEAFGKIDLEEPTITSHWQSRVDALAVVLFKRKVILVDEFRRFIEALPSNTYASFHYYGKWATSLLQVLLRKGLLKEKSVFAQLYGGQSSSDQLFQVGDSVKVLRYDVGGALFRRPHLRTPGYVFGKKGIIQSFAGMFLPPQLVSWNFDAEQAIEPQPVYRVRFRFGDIWQHDPESANDTIDVEIFQEWLKANHHDESHDHDRHDHAHVHGHTHSTLEDHGHTHETKLETERVAIEREFSMSVQEEAIAECLLQQVVEAGIVTAEELLEAEALRDSRSNDPVGPKVVAKAWQDEAFRKALLHDGSKAIKEVFGVDPNCKLVVFQNTSQVRNLIVCTLCSCYPTAILVGFSFSHLIPLFFKKKRNKTKKMEGTSPCLV